MLHKIDYDDYCNCILILNCSYCKENVFYTFFLKIFIIVINIVI